MGESKVEAMTPRISQKKTAALTLEEVLVSIVVLAMLAGVALLWLRRPHDGAKEDWRKTTWCANNLKQVGLAYRIWEGDNNDKYPMQVSMTNGGSMELVAAGNVVTTFQVMSNELSTPKIVVCPQDLNRDYAANFTTDFNSSRISYFVGADADEKKPQMFLSGDANFEISGVPVKSGLLEISSNTPIAWTTGRHWEPAGHLPTALRWPIARHVPSGNILLADGSVESGSHFVLTNLLSKSGLATNRLAVP